VIANSPFCGVEFEASNLYLLFPRSVTDITAFNKPIGQVGVGVGVGVTSMHPQGAPKLATAISLARAKQVGSF
jgi:hypothetical protein